MSVEKRLDEAAKIYEQAMRIITESKVQMSDLEVATWTLEAAKLHALCALVEALRELTP